MTTTLKTKYNKGLNNHHYSAGISCMFIRSNCKNERDGSVAASEGKDSMRTGCP